MAHLKFRMICSCDEALRINMSYSPYSFEGKLFVCPQNLRDYFNANDEEIEKYREWHWTLTPSIWKTWNIERRTSFDSSMFELEEILQCWTCARPLRRKPSLMWRRERSRLCKPCISRIFFVDSV